MSRKTRKLIWSVPLVAVFAVVGALAAFVALTPNGTQAHDLALPGIVTEVTAEAKGRDTIEVTWKAPPSGGPITYYRIDRSENGNVWMRLVEMHTGSTSITDMMGLKPSKFYSYRVFAVNSAGSSESSDISEHSGATTAAAGKPGVVRMLTATVEGPNQINLSWYPPEDNGGKNVARYCISTAQGIADVTGTAGTLLPVAASPAAELSPDGGTTNIACAAGTAPRAYAVPTPTTGTPAGHLTAIREGDSSGVIVIRAPEDGSMMVSYMHKDLPAATSRRYEVYAVNEVGRSEVATAVAPIPETDAAGKPGKPTLRLVPSFPGADVDTTDVDERTVPTGAASLYWTWPDNGGKEIVSWRLQRKIDGGSWTDLSSGTDLTEAVQIAEDDLTADRARDLPEYAISGTDLLPDAADANNTSTSETTQYRVRAYNGTTGASGGPWSNTAAITLRQTWDAATTTSVVTPMTPTPAAGMVSSPPGKYLRQIDLSWTDQSNTSYLIDYAITEGGNAAPNNNEDPTDDTNREWMPLQTNTGYSKSTYNHVKDLNPGESRHYRVTPISNGVYGSIGITNGSTKAAVKPEAVRGLKTSSDDPTMIKLEWDKPADDGGQPITGYRVDISAYDGFENPSDGPPSITHHLESCDPPAGTAATTDSYCAREVMGADNTEYVLTKLDAGTDRWFRVFAINKVFTADTDEPDADDVRKAVKIKGTSASSGTPGMPQDLTVQPARDSDDPDPAKRGIDILWNAPDDPDGDSVTSYVVARRTKASADADWSAWKEDWATVPNDGQPYLTTHVTDTDEPDNFANGEMRQYRVKAKSGAGSGPSTAVVTYPVMEGAHGHVMASGTITAQTLTVGDMETVDASMYFTNAMSYSVMSSMPMYATAMVDENTGMVTINAVAAGMSDITVTATDMFGNTATQMFTVTVEAASTALTAPMNVMASSTTATQMDLTWEGGENADLFILVAYDTATGDIQLATVTDATMRSGDVTGLTSGSQYLGLVIAVQGSGADLVTMYDYDRTNPITTIQ